jgi:hypothetical protein
MDAFVEQNEGRWKERILYDRPSRTNSIESVVKV